MKKIYILTALLACNLHYAMQAAEENPEEQVYRAVLQQRDEAKKPLYPQTDEEWAEYDRDFTATAVYLRGFLSHWAKITTPLILLGAFRSEEENENNVLHKTLKDTGHITTAALFTLVAVDPFISRGCARGVDSCARRVNNCCRPGHEKAD